MPEPLNQRQGKAHSLPFDLKRFAENEEDLRKLVHSIVKASQENFDSLSGDARANLKQFNLLAKDVQFIAEYLGVEHDGTGTPSEVTGGLSVTSHDELEDVSANDHHNQSHNQSDHDSAEAADILTITPDGAIAAGTSVEVPNADHHHGLVTSSSSAAAVGIDSGAAAGTSGTVQRAAHVHQVTTTDAPSGANISVDAAASAAATGAIARAAHGHRLNTSASEPGAVSTTTSGTAGTSATAPSRGDHAHDLGFDDATADPSAVAAAAADGTATSAARKDHVHAHGTGYAGSHSDAVNDGDAAGGDLSGTYPNPSVTDDSHAHTSTTVTTHSTAHAASAVTADSTTLVGVGTDVQAVLEELDNGIADHLADTADAHDASAVSFVPYSTIAATDVQAAIQEVLDEATAGAPANADYLVGTANGGLSAEIVVGTSPGGELGGTWASPTVDATHSGSAHHTQSHDHSSAGDGTTLTPATLNIPTAAVPAQTADGQAVWDSNDNLLTVGDGVALQTFLPVSDAGSDPVAVNTSAADGTEATVARKDHRHAHEAAHIAHDTIFDAKGDIVTGSGADTAVKTGVGADGTFLKADSGAAGGVSWAAGGGGGDVATDVIWGAKGELAVGTGLDTAAVLSVGANDTVLMADSAETTGLKWVSPGAGQDIDWASAGATGSADTFARGDHTHKALTNTGTPSAVTTAGSAGSAATAPARYDHEHAHEAAHINHDTTWAAKGDLIAATANDTAAVVTVGADGKYLKADSGAAAGVSWVAGATDVQVFTAATSAGTPTLDTAAANNNVQDSNTWTRPVGNYTEVEVILIGAGGGGGGGRRSNGAANSTGGAAGAGAGMVRVVLPYSLFTTSETVLVGVAGTGGGGRSANNDGLAGGTGGDSSMTVNAAAAFLLAKGGPGGAGGVAGTSLADTSAATGSTFPSTRGGVGTGSASGSASTNAADFPSENATLGPYSFSCPGGGGGGGCASTGTPRAGGDGGGAWDVAQGNGGATSNNGSPGSTKLAQFAVPGSGGGGGGGSATVAGGAGGAAGNYGAGGGGGGAVATVAANSGNGGNGGHGIVIVITR